MPWGEAVVGVDPSDVKCVRFEPEPVPSEGESETTASLFLHPEPIAAVLSDVAGGVASGVTAKFVLELFPTLS